MTTYLVGVEHRQFLEQTNTMRALLEKFPRFESTKVLVCCLMRSDISKEAIIARSAISADVSRLNDSTECLEVIAHSKNGSSFYRLH